jgi:hypothetical protein
MVRKVVTVIFACLLRCSISGDGRARQTWLPLGRAYGPAANRQSKGGYDEAHWTDVGFNFDCYFVR